MMKVYSCEGGGKKRSKKDLPEDFVSSENFNEKGHMMPVLQKTPVTASQKRWASATSQAYFQSLLLRFIEFAGPSEHLG
ncbi:hypothetical protein GWK47_011364 [Chionoecetes opilio]|uniref:Uncharacterized protein n=1 Tax=Chionoecetes opilio TaxID=41210 RepID=A0A8J5CMB7_CHIOP|nr:hypothetical protein GWK47_011364 [Chionoecetes opilio]